MLADKSLTDDRMISLYRIMSLIVTSLLYLCFYSDHSILRKIIIIFLLTILTLTLNYIYTKNNPSKKKINSLIFIESIGNAIILIPGGGLTSPYVWYSLNTILLSSIKLKRKYAWINLCFYLLVASTITANSLSLLDAAVAMKKQSNIIIGLFLVTALIQVLAEVNKDLVVQKEKLLEANLRLIKANREAKEYLFFIMNIYECVDVLTAQQNVESLKRMIIDYTKIISGSNQISFITNHSRDTADFKLEILSCQDNDKEFIPYIENSLEALKQNEIYLEVNESGSAYILSLVKNDYKIYGILCAVLNSCDMKNLENEILNKIRFLSKISAMGFGKIEVGDLTEKLIADKERNRIADEIHDGVLQKLFGLSCALFNVSKKISFHENTMIEKDIKKFRMALNVAITELRETIYGLSSKKDGNDSFTGDIYQLIHEMKSLNDIDINFLTVGDFGLLTTGQKKAFYRIICESISNSVRHGNATKVEIELSVLYDHINLKIADNGTGFESESLSEEKMGLGIRNMKHLIYSLNGFIEIKSTPGNGTKIIATVKNNDKFAS